MSVHSHAHVVTQDPTKVCDCAWDDSTAGYHAFVRNDGARDIFIGGADVTAGTGFRLDPGQSLSIQMYGGECLYAVTEFGVSDLAALLNGIRA